MSRYLAAHKFPGYTRRLDNFLLNHVIPGMQPGSVRVVLGGSDLVLGLVYLFVFRKYLFKNIGISLLFSGHGNILPKSGYLTLVVASSKFQIDVY